MTNYIEFPAKEGVITTEQQAKRLVELAWGGNVHKLLVLQASLSPDFFDLSTGLAGAVLQMLANYHLQTAFVVDKSTIKSERFQELMTETEFNDEYRFFATKEAAEAWLLGEE